MTSSPNAEVHVRQDRHLTSVFASLRDRLGPKEFRYPSLHPYGDVLRILCLLPSIRDNQ